MDTELVVEVLDAMWKVYEREYDAAVKSGCDGVAQYFLGTMHALMALKMNLGLVGK